MYALTGASGQLGRLIIKNLLDRVPANQILATTRQPEKLASFAARGVIVRPADLNDPASLPDAFAGATRLLLISTSEFGKQTAQSQAAIEAALRAGVTHLFYTSAPKADTGLDHWLLKEFAETEILLREAGINWTALRNNIYTDLLPDMLRTLIEGDRLYILAGPGKPVWISREDCARAAAGALAGDDSITGPVEVTGPEALSFVELAARLSELQGREITPQVVTEAELAARLTAKGLPEPAISVLLRITGWLTDGDFGPVTQAVEQLTGRQPTSIDEALRTLAQP